jgi:hypothetical protein
MSDYTEPKNLVEQAGDAGIQAIHEHLAHADAKVESLIILLTIDSAPEGEPDTVTCGTEIEDEKALIAMLGAHFIQAANAIGVQVNLVPIQGRPQG